MAISSRRLAGIISSLAASIYFFIIILQVPLFRVPCKKAGGSGTILISCRTPVEVITCYQLMENEIFLLPTLAMKALLYPGAVTEAFIYNNPIPKFHHYNIINNCQNFDFHQIEVIAGSYLCVAGAIIGILKGGDAGRMSLCGILMIIMLWGKFDEDEQLIITDLHREKVLMMKIYPTLWFALLLTFLSIKRDVRALIRSSFRT